MPTSENPQIAALRRAIAHPNIGSQTNLALLLSAETGRTLKQGHVSHWLKVGLPAAYCPAVEKLTAGGVLCEDLDPSVDWSILRTATRDQETTHA